MWYDFVFVVVVDVLAHLKFGIAYMKRKKHTSSTINVKKNQMFRFKNKELRQQYAYRIEIEAAAFRDAIHSI